MTEKRYFLHKHLIKNDVIHDNICHKWLKGEELESDMNTLYNKYSSLKRENEQLKKELHLMHMRSMFSTVKSFKGDLSKRYKYDEETDTIYDTANHYGQYDKILDKKEIVMLLNEYNTLLGDNE